LNGYYNHTLSGEESEQYGIGGEESRENDGVSPG